MSSLQWRGASSFELQEDSSSSSKRNTALQAFHCAIEIILKLKQAKQEQGTNEGVLVRVGCSSGTILGGIISRYKFAYDIFGTVVDTAELLSSMGSPLSFSLCSDTQDLVQQDLHALLATNPDFESNCGCIPAGIDKAAHVPHYFN